MRHDRFTGKHEGPRDRDGVFHHGDPEFLQVEGRYAVLRPVDRQQHPNVAVTRCDVTRDGGSLTRFLKDTTHRTDPGHERFDAGRVAVCDRLGEVFHVAVFYHAWYTAF